MPHYQFFNYGFLAEAVIDGWIRKGGERWLSSVIDRFPVILTPW